jgi:hypothetical protein
MPVGTTPGYGALPRPVPLDDGGGILGRGAVQVQLAVLVLIEEIGRRCPPTGWFADIGALATVCCLAACRTGRELTSV